MDEREAGYLLAVSAAAVWTPRPLAAMLQACGGARKLIAYARNREHQAPPPCELLGSGALDRIAAISEQSAAAALQHARKQHLSILSWTDPDYPARLLDLCDPPPVIYVKGDHACLRQKTIVIVGSRSSTPYGRSMATRMAADFALYGAIVVSGLARGIDAAAHRGALEASASTIAVLGSGLSALYPTYHRELAAEIAAQGAVISEFPPTMAARPHHFPMRNRIVAALGDATLVVEAGIKSGALITARLAGDLGRPVFALPGDVGRATSEGTNGLIKDGVTLTTSAEDLASVLGWPLVVTPATTSVSIKIPLLGAITGHAYAIDEICAQTGLEPATIAAELTMLEMQGLVERRAGGTYMAVDRASVAN